MYAAILKTCDSDKKKKKKHKDMESGTEMVEKANPYHAKDGTFASKPGGSGGVADKDASHKVVRWNGDKGVNVRSWDEAKGIASDYMKEQMDKYGKHSVVSVATMENGKPKMSGYGPQALRSIHLLNDYKPPKAKAKKMEFIQILKANPYHGKDGRFSSKDKAVPNIGGIQVGVASMKDFNDALGIRVRQSTMSKFKAAMGGLHGDLGGTRSKVKSQHQAAHEDYARAMGDQGFKLSSAKNIPDTGWGSGTAYKYKHKDGSTATYTHWSRGGVQIETTMGKGRGYITTSTPKGWK